MEPSGPQVPKTLDTDLLGRGAGPYFAAVDPAGGAPRHRGHRPRGGAARRPGRHAGLVRSRSHPRELGAVTAEISDLCRRYGSATWSATATRASGFARRSATHAWGTGRPPGRRPRRTANWSLSLWPASSTSGTPGVASGTSLSRAPIIRPAERDRSPTGAHDDHVNALALAVAHALRSRSRDTEFDETDRPEGSSSGSHGAVLHRNWMT